RELPEAIGRVVLDEREPPVVRAARVVEVAPRKHAPARPASGALELLLARQARAAEAAVRARSEIGDERDRIVRAQEARRPFGVRGGRAVAEGRAALVVTHRHFRSVDPERGQRERAPSELVREGLLGAAVSERLGGAGRGRAEDLVRGRAHHEAALRDAHHPRSGRSQHHDAARARERLGRRRRLRGAGADGPGQAAQQRRAHEGAAPGARAGGPHGAGAPSFGAISASLRSGTAFARPEVLASALRSGTGSRGMGLWLIAEGAAVPGNARSASISAWPDARDAQPRFRPSPTRKPEIWAQDSAFGGSLGFSGGGVFGARGGGPYSSRSFRNSASRSTTSWYSGRRGSWTKSFTPEGVSTTSTEPFASPLLPGSG